MLEKFWVEKKLRKRMIKRKEKTGETLNKNEIMRYEAVKEKSKSK